MADISESSGVRCPACRKWTMEHRATDKVEWLECGFCGERILPMIPLPAKAACAKENDAAVAQERPRRKPEGPGQPVKPQTLTSGGTAVLGGGGRPRHHALRTDAVPRSWLLH